MTAAEQAPHPRAGPAQAASNQPVSSSVEIDKTPQFHWVDIDPLPPSPLLLKSAKSQNRSHVSACSRSCARADYDDRQSYEKLDKTINSEAQRHGAWQTFKDRLMVALLAALALLAGQQLVGFMESLR